MANPDNVAFTLFGKDIYWYGVLMALGIIVAIILATSEAKRKKLYKDAVIDIALWTVPLGIIGARLYYVIFNFGIFADNPISILYIWQGGLAIYGAIIGGIIGGIIYCSRNKVPFLRVADIAAPGLVLAQAIGRWGNFFNQEAFGRPITDAGLYWFPFAVRIDSTHYFDGAICSNPYHMATFFYESMWCLIIFIVIWSIRKKFKHDGDAFLLYALLYSVERMVVEGLRGDSLYLFDTGIRVSQLLSFILFILVLAFFIYRFIREKKGKYISWCKPYSIAPIIDYAQEHPEIMARKYKKSSKSNNVNEDDVQDSSDDEPADNDEQPQGRTDADEDIDPQIDSQNNESLDEDNEGEDK